MKTSMYFNYTTRSLQRGGQRTVLALFCVAVGVMAIVALQLVGLMINNALTSNVRVANGGDVAITSFTKPFTTSDLSFFDQLKSNGTITSYTALSSSRGVLTNATRITSKYSILAVDPATYPVVTPPTFVNPTNSSIASLLTGNQVIVDTILADQLNKKVGDTLIAHGSSNTSGNTLVLQVKIAGIVTDSGVLAQNSGVMLVSRSYFATVAPASAELYNMVNVITADQQHTDKAVQSINTHFPLASTQTVADTLKSQQDLVDTVRKFLEIAGLLALLIGGVGIVNTMQVLLSRRKIEIAMLKTNGYKRHDLVLLFGLEAGLIGLIGGVIGALAATGVSYLLRGLVQKTFNISIPFVLDPPTIAGGVLIGLVTALIFGLMPIAQAANIRPLNVIRELPSSNRAGSIALTAGLLIVVSALFCLLSIFILNNAILGIGAVYGTFIFLGLLSLFFTPVVVLVGKLPVPERFNLRYLGLLLLGVVLAVLIALVLPTFGYLVLALTVVGFVVVLLPRAWKSSAKMALRNIGRQRARTTTTLLALFVGIFTVGLILILGLNLRDIINTSVSGNQTYNVEAIASKNEVDALQAGQSTIPGLSKTARNSIVTTVPVSINNQSMEDILKGVSANSASNSPGREDVLGELSGAQSFDVANNQFPDTTNVQITQGRNLVASDAGSNNVLIPVQLADLESIAGHIGVNSTLVLSSADGKQSEMLTVVGVYNARGVGGPQEPLLTTTSAVQGLSQAGMSQEIFYMKIAPDSVGKALATIGELAPNALVLNQNNITEYIDQFLNYILLTLITVAGLSLLAGIIIIANAVALAMLERRRELGILKSVGYTSGTVLSEVLIENGIVGGLGAILAMLFVTLAINILGRLAFHATFSVNGLIALVLIVGAALLAMITAALVAYRSVRVRPLEVLRYE